MSGSKPSARADVYVCAGAKISGSLNARGEVVVDGLIAGDVACAELIVGANGVVEGEVATTDADIAGCVSSKISVVRTLMVRAAGCVEGAWSCEELKVEKGAVLRSEAEPSCGGQPYGRRPERRATRLKLVYDRAAAE